MLLFYSNVLVNLFYSMAEKSLLLPSFTRESLVYNLTFTTGWENSSVVDWAFPAVLLQLGSFFAFLIAMLFVV